jgi:DNA-binding SARP family transcriptional activator/tetratricopeptide (TPR) repeat protein
LAVVAAAGLLRFAVLGPLRAWRDTTELDLGSPQQKATLAALLLREGAATTAGELVDAVWGDDPPRAAIGTLRTYVSRLRRTLDPSREAHVASGVVESIGDGYVLRVEPGALDLGVFRASTARAEASLRAGDLVAAAAQLTGALDLWDGPPLGGVQGSYADVQRSRLTELRLAALEARLDLDLRLGRQLAVTAELSTLTAEYPFRERLRELLMRALYLSGRQSEALAVYDDVRRLLADDLGIDPGPALRALHQRVLRSNPDLMTPTWIDAPVAAPQAGLSVPSVESAEALPTPAQLPADLADFTGRGALVSKLGQQLTGAGSAVRVAAVAGLGGVGKTSLAIHVAHAVGREFPDGQLYADLEGMSDEPADPHTVLAAFLRSFGVTERSLPERLDDRAALYRSTLAGKRVLVVLDNAKDVEQIRSLLPGASGSAVMVTSRRRLVGLPGARWTDLEVLEPAEALDLMVGIVCPDRVRAEPDSARALVQACGYLPLAVRIVGSRLATRPAWTLAEMSRRVRDERRRLTELRMDDLAVEATFELGHRQLDPEQARAFRLAALPDGPDLSLAAASAVLDLAEPDAERLLESLVDLHLVESHGPGRYRYHDLVRVFARQRSLELDEGAERSGVFRRLVEFYLATARNAYRLAEPASHAPDDTVAPTVGGLEFDTADGARTWLLDEHTHVLSAVEQAAGDGATGTDVLADLLLMISRLGDHGVGWRRLESAATTVAEIARIQTRPRDEARARYLQARLLNQHTQTEPQPILIAAIELARTAGDLRMLELALARLASAHYNRGHLDDAARGYVDAYAIQQRLGDRQRMAVTLANLAEVRRQQGRLAEAVEMSERGLALARPTGDILALVYTTFSTSSALLAVGRLDEARAMATEALQCARTAGFGMWEVYDQVLLAEIERAGGDLLRALDHAEQAVQVGHRIGYPDRESEGLIVLGEVLADLGQTDRALAAWREVDVLLSQVSPSRAEYVRAQVSAVRARHAADEVAG